jgi:hypothetical protein
MPVLFPLCKVAVHANVFYGFSSHLAAEVGVAWRVHDVDLGALVVDGRVLGQNRNPALALLVVAVHHALAHILVGAEHVRLLQHGVHERRLAVVHVRYSKT